MEVVEKLGTSSNQRFGLGRRVEVSTDAHRGDRASAACVGREFF